MQRPRCAAFVVVSAVIAAALPSLPAMAQTATGAIQLAQKSTAPTRADTKKKTAKAVASKKAPEWRFSRNLGAPTLAFGLDTKDEILLSFSCQPDSGLLRVLSMFGSRGLRPGDGAAIRFSNGKLRFEVAGTAFSTESRDDVDIGGATRIDPKLFALFRVGDTLVIDVPGRTRSVPLANARASAEAFQKACMASNAGGPAPAG
jgi:hypothetical protein